MNPINRAIATLTMQVIEEGKITRVIDPRLPHEVTFFLHTPEVAADQDPSIAGGTAPWNTPARPPAFFISTLGNHQGNAGAWGEDGIRLSYLSEYNAVVLRAAMTDVGHAFDAARGALTLPTNNPQAPYAGSSLQMAVDAFLRVCEQSAELVTGERCASAEDFLRAFYRPVGPGQGIGHIQQRWSSEAQLLQQAHALYSWSKLLPENHTQQEALMHYSGFAQSAPLSPSWGYMAHPRTPGFNRGVEPHSFPHHTSVMRPMHPHERD